jgi:cephalosporin hydroxylase
MMVKKFLQLLKNGVKILLNLILHRIYITPQQEKSIVDQFHKLYYDSHHFDKTWSNTFWLGIQTSKCPLDLWIYQEIIFELKPDIIIESGTAKGGECFISSLYV